MAAASPLHGGRALGTVPLPLGSLGQTHTAVVEPLDGTLRTQRPGQDRKRPVSTPQRQRSETESDTHVCVVTADHFSVGNLEENTVTN